MIMKKVDFLPLGSTVIVRGNVKKVIIIARGLATAIEKEVRYFDYGGVTYPEGLIGDAILYFNHKDIAEIIHHGYTDEDETRMVKNLQTWMEQSELIQGDPCELNQANRGKRGALQ